MSSGPRPCVLLLHAVVRELPILERALAPQIPRAELVLLKRAGHLLPHLHAEELATIMLGTGVPVG